MKRLLSAVVSALSVTAVVGVATLSLAPQAAFRHYLWHEDAEDTKDGVDLRGLRLYRKGDPNRGVLRARTYEEIDLGGDPDI